MMRRLRSASGNATGAHPRRCDSRTAIAIFEDPDAVLSRCPGGPLPRSSASTMALQLATLRSPGHRPPFGVVPAFRAVDRPFRQDSLDFFQLARPVAFDRTVQAYKIVV